MKKLVILLAVSAALFIAAFPTTAFAESQSNGRTEVSYTVGSSYSVNIPASINLNENPYLTITATSMNISFGQRVSVFIDGENTYENGGNFYLYKDKGQANEEKMRCDLKVGNSNVTGLDGEVGRFDDGDTTNKCDPLQFIPAGGAPGTYSGTIYFKISME